MSNNLYNEHKKIYMKYLIHKIIESKLTKIQNNINNNNFLLDFNYSNIKKEFKNILNHKGGDYYFGPSPSLYTYPIYFPYDTVFTKDNDESLQNQPIQPTQPGQPTQPTQPGQPITNEEIKKNIKKTYDEIIKFKNIFTKISEKEINIINEMNTIIDDINKYIKEDNYNEEKLNQLFTKFLNIIRQFNKKECEKLKKTINKENPELSERINKLCKE